MPVAVQARPLRPAARLRLISINGFDVARPAGLICSAMVWLRTKIPRLAMFLSHLQRFAGFRRAKTSLRKIDHSLRLNISASEICSLVAFSLPTIACKLVRRFQQGLGLRYHGGREVVFANACVGVGGSTRHSSPQQLPSSSLISLRNFLLTNCRAGRLKLALPCVLDLRPEARHRLQQILDEAHNKAPGTSGCPSPGTICCTQRR